MCPTTFLDESMQVVHFEGVVQLLPQSWPALGSRPPSGLPALVDLLSRSIVDRPEFCHVFLDEHLRFRANGVRYY